MSKIDIHHLTKKQRKQMHGWLRAIIQLLYFLFLPSAYTAAFAGVKYIFTQLGAGEKISLTSFVSVLIVLCLYTIVFGRSSVDLPVHSEVLGMQFTLSMCGFAKKSRKSR